MTNSSIPPIASPVGSGAPAPTPSEDENLNQFCASVRVDLKPGALWRYLAFEWLAPVSLGLYVGAPLMMALSAFPDFSRRGFPSFFLVFLLFFLPIFLISAFFCFIVRLCSQRRYVMRLSSDGVVKAFARREVHFSWRKLLRVVEVRGNVWFGSLTDGCFIPREAFSSREEAREFVAIAREMRSDGVWRDQWNGRVFGVQPLDGERNNPR